MCTFSTRRSLSFSYNYVSVWKRYNTHTYLHTVHIYHLPFRPFETHDVIQAFSYFCGPGIWAPIVSKLELDRAWFLWYDFIYINYPSRVKTEKSNIKEAASELEK